MSPFGADHWLIRFHIIYFVDVGKSLDIYFIFKYIFSLEKEMPKSVNSRASSSNFNSSSKDDNNTLAEARKVYKSSVLWHGTKHEHLKSLREAGFSKSLKRDGATVGGTEMKLKNFSSAAEEDAREHHYLSTSKEEAKHFAMFADIYNPALARTIGLRNNFDLTMDHETSDAALRTNQSIPPRFVLGSKISAPGENARVFKDEMAVAGHDVSVEQAGALLREVQSDSDDDTFPDPEEFIMSRLWG